MKKNRETIYIISFFIVSFILFLVAAIGLLSKKTEESNTELVQLSQEEGGFLYYNGDVYYKHPYLCVPSDLRGEEIGQNEWNIQYSDIDSKTRTFSVEEGKSLCVYAYEEGLSVFKHKNREDVLILQDDDYLYSGIVYIKDTNISEYAYHSFEAFLTEEPDSIKLIGPMLYEIPMEFKVADFTYDSNELGSPSSFEGYLPFYLILEKNGLYTKVEGTGNAYLDYIVITSSDNYGNEPAKNYVCNKEGLSEVLLELYNGGAE